MIACNRLIPQFEGFFMPAVFISGANRGLGLEFARQYAAAGWQVVGACREPAHADALQAVSGVTIVPLDVGDTASIEALSANRDFGKLDLLINNAGIFGSSLSDNSQTLEAMEGANWLDIFRVNAIGPFEVTRALLPRLAPGAKIGIISSQLASIAGNASGGIYGYRAAKAAVNMVGRSLSVDLKARGFIVLLLDPGWVQTDMGGAGAPLTPTQSVTGLCQVIAKAGPDANGRFLIWDGREASW
jgi:NAD(P)-dependent dehydrogenase (short-subunit alcohol dehydrogenase family)